MFDLHRFLLLAHVHWAERGRSYLWFLGIGIVVHACVWLLITQGGFKPGDYVNDFQYFVFFAGLTLTALLFAGLEFSPLGRREAALTWLMRPATALEKFLLAFLIVAVLYPLAYTLAFQVCNLPGGWLAQVVAQANPSRTINPDQYKLYFPFADASNRPMELTWLLITNALQALVIAGGLRFRNLAWLKTLVALFLLLAIALPLLLMFADADIGMLFPAGEVPPEATSFRALRWLLWIGVPGLFWASAYFFLRDRELH